MSKIDFTTRMLRELKGAPLSCIIAMSIAGQAVSAGYLERNTGYSDKSVNDALLYLQENGYITRNGRYAWCICMDAQQLPLMTLPEETDPNLAAYEEADRENNLECESTRRNSDSENFRVPSTSSSRSLTSFNQQDQLLLPGTDDPEKFRVAENLTACDRFGIMEPKRSALCRLAHVTTRLIDYHCAKAENIRLAIYRIEHNWKVPRDWSDPNDRNDKLDDVSLINVCAQTLSPEEISDWERVVESVKPDFKPVEFETWIKSAVPVRMESDRWVIRTGNQFSREWIRKHALERLQEAAGVVIEIEEGRL